MRWYVDLHSHSRFARACSPQLDLPHLAKGCVEKGINLLGTGDFTHPVWFGELQAQLEPVEGTGLYRLKEAFAPEAALREVRFLLTSEVATITPTDNGAKKVHHLLHVPSLEEAAQIRDALAKRWKAALDGDGRPALGGCTPAELVELVREASPASEIVSAHAWTPWFGVFGSRGGFDSLKAAYEDQAPKILGVETGMSSTPAMNWRLSELDSYAIISGSDLHSPYPWRLGRECCAFEFGEAELTYEALMRALRERDQKHFVFTVEVDPSYGKYHYDGHRNCGVSLAPEASKKMNGRCPVCKRRLTIGVLARVEQLADRPEGFTPKNAIPFVTPLPLHELLAAAYRTQLASQKVALEYQRILAVFGNEFRVLLDASEAELAKATHEKIARAILLNREGKLSVKPGYDGVYGELQLPEEVTVAPAKREKNENATGLGFKRQRSLGEFSEA